MPADALAVYDELVEQACRTLPIQRDVALVAADNWGMQPGDTFTIYCGGMDGQHVLLHYLAHARMLEAGWQQPAFRHDTRQAFLYANRSADAFTDFWAYRLVGDVFGAHHLQAYTAWIADTTPEQVLADLEQEAAESDEDAVARRCTVFAVDWFGAAPVLLQEVDADRAAAIVELFDALQETAFSDYAPDDIGDRVAAIRHLFQEFGAEYGTFRGLRDAGQEDAFHAFYAAVWPADPPAMIDGFVPLSAFTADPA